MGVATLNDIIDRISDDYTLWQPIYQEMQGSAINNNNLSIHRCGISKALPSLPSGVTSYIPTCVEIIGSTTTTTYLVGKMVSFGTYNNGTDTFTDGSSMGTKTCLGATVNMASPIWFEATTALNSSPGSITVTYVDQDGNTAEAATAFTLPASGPIRTVSLVYLNSPDWGARDVTNVTRSGGSSHAGVVELWGMLPICMMNSIGAGGCVEPLLTYNFAFTELGAGDVVGVFNVGTTAAKANLGRIFIVGDS